MLQKTKTKKEKQSAELWLGEATNSINAKTI
jgi:hypothetical protein